MTGKEASKVLNAAVLEVMPHRKCSGCGDPLPVQAPSEPHAMEDGGGLVVLFWCQMCGPTPRAEA